MMIAGTRLAFQAPEIIVGQIAENNPICPIFALLLIPFHTLIMSIREEILNQQLHGKRDETLEAHRVKIRSQVRQFKRCELGIETVYQLCGITILSLYAITNTKTTEGLVQLFESNPEETLSALGKQNVFQSKSFILTYLIISTVWSCYSCLESSIESLSLRREHLPTMSKVIAQLFVLCSLLRRVLAIVMYFSVPLGLFDLLRHAQSEQVEWDPAIGKYFLDQDGYIQFGESPKILWSTINRWNASTQKPPSYKLYTLFGIKEYFLGFWAISTFQAIAIFLAKLKFCQAFKEMTIFNKIVHIQENINISQCTEDWDHRSGSAKDHVKRKDANFREFYVLSLINYFFNAVLLLPLSMLGNQIYLLIMEKLVVNNFLL